MVTCYINSERGCVCVCVRGDDDLIRHLFYRPRDLDDALEKGCAGLMAS